MSAGPLLVLVPPQTQFAHSDEDVERLVRSVFGTDAERLRAMDILLKVLRPTFTPLPRTRSERIDDAMPLLIELVRALLEARPELALAGTGVAIHTDESLRKAEITVLGDAKVVPRVVYCEHPQRPDHYIRLADFHRYLLDEKRSEFERLAAALGAKEIRMIESSERRKNIHAEASAAIPIHGVRVEPSLTVDHRDETRDEFGLEASFAPPRARPYTPDGLAWLRAEPQWQAMVDARVGSSNALRRKITFRYTTDYSVNAELESKVLGWGLTCGGTLHKMRTVSTEYLVEFYPSD